jgi:predicted ABC-type exoprotein transport system permease subunit
MSPSDLLLLNALIGVVIPLLVALVTKNVSSDRFKSLALLVLTAVGAYLSQLLLSDGPVNWETVARTALTIGVAAVASFFGFTKPMGIAGSDGVIQRKVSGGFGKAA